MNLLAHAFLSFGNKGLLTGNMISDFVKGKAQYHYPDEILAGIKLHRAIDDFTDTHPAVKEVKEFFRPAYRLYAGAFTDVVFDYFLANDPDQFESEDALKKFTERSYAMLKENAVFFPPTFASMFPHMVAHDWLFNYRLNEGIRKSLAGVGRRALYISETETAYRIFLDEKNKMQSFYDIFFPELKTFAAEKADQLLQK